MMNENMCSSATLLVSRSTVVMGLKRMLIALCRMDTGDNMHMCSKIPRFRRADQTAYRKADSCITDVL